MTSSMKSLLAVLLIAAAPSISLAQTSAGTSKPVTAPAALTPVVKPVAPSEEEMREAARQHLLKGAQAPKSTAQQQSKSTAAATGGLTPVRTSSHADEPRHQDPVREAYADQIGVQNTIALRQQAQSEEAFKREQDRADAALREQLVRERRAQELAETVQLADMQRQARYDDVSVAASWQALDNDLANGYQSLAFTDAALASQDIALQSQITGNRAQYWGLKSWKQWDNLNRSQAVMGNSLGDFSGIGAGILNLAMHGHEDEIDHRYETQFNQQQSDMLRDVDDLRTEHRDVRKEMRDNYRLRLEALKARQRASDASFAPQPSAPTQTVAPSR